MPYVIVLACNIILFQLSTMRVKKSCTVLFLQ